MKVIFLDHDGVICLASEWGGRHKKQKEWGGRKLSMSNNAIPLEYRFDNFNQKAVKTLNKILEETGAEIVVSSDWKLHATLEELGDYYESQGIIKRPIALTPNIQNCTAHSNLFIWSPRWELEQTRTIEIQQYLHDHPEVTHWVSVDDLNMGAPYTDPDWGDIDRDWGLTNFVLTPKSREGIKQSGIKESILKFLGNGN